MMLTVFRTRAARSKFNTVRLSRDKCSLCNQFCSRGLNFSTESAGLQPNSKSIENAIKKRAPRRKARFAELLEVGDSTLQEMQTKIKKLSSKNLNKVQTVSRYSKLTAANRRSTHSLNSEFHEEDVDSKEDRVIDEGALFSLASVDPTTIDEMDSSGFTRSKKEMYSKLTKRQLSQVDSGNFNTAGRERSLNESLMAYIELCVQAGFTYRGWMSLNYYINSSKKRKVEISNVHLFDAVMLGFASLGQFDKLMEVWQKMESLEIQPTPNSFSLRIESIARSSKRDKVELLESTLTLMEQKGFDLNTTFIQRKWQKDSQEVVLKALKVVRPQFSPLYPPPKLDYDNPLLTQLNKADTSTLVSPVEGILTKEQLKSFFTVQLAAERNATIVVKSIETEPIETEELKFHRKRLTELMESWEKCVMAALNREISTLNSLHKNTRTSYLNQNLYPYLVILEKHQYKNIIMQEVRKLAEGSETFSPTASYLHRSLGHQVNQRYVVKVKSDNGVLEKVEAIYQRYLEWYTNPQTSSTACNGRQQWQELKHLMTAGPNVDDAPVDWPLPALLGIGKFLYKIILRDIKVDVNIMKPKSTTKHLLPAFYSVYRHQGFSVKEEIKPHPIISRLYRAAALPHLTFNANDTPSLCPPIPWSSVESGGYIVSKTHLIRLPQQAVQQWERMKAAPECQLFPCFDSLNQLASIPWKVNQRVLDIVIQLFNSGGCPKLDIPEPPSSLVITEQLTPGMSSAEKAQIIKQRTLMRRKKADMYSLWCDALYRLSLANHYRDRLFWLPHNMDFRGRVYPCPPHLNHLGSDMPRSLLVFAKGQPLGPKGLDWLKIHAVNLTGLKKRNCVEDRLKYANTILPLIIDSATKPLDGEKWWMRSEEPWQTLACCIEINDALNCREGPENFVSHFPVHQDGSCNGLQHYAALGRDSAGAFSVNLAPAPEPQDVYSAVATIVEKSRAADAANGVEVAKQLEGFIKRKVVKQTVMTTVYGVTRFGARLQIAKQLKDLDSFPKNNVWNASHYLATKTFESIREMFTSTREIQEWFTESARMISGMCERSVEYVTPLGLPVVQPYVRNTTRTNDSKKTSGKYSEYSKMDTYERPNVMKQKNAFPPNFIHSLDSTHMMLTSLHCERAGITFVSVHDCFWSHPNSIELLNRICREQFVSLHSQPILETLSQFLLKEFGYTVNSALSVDDNTQLAMAKLNKLLGALPRKGNFDLKNVMDSVYFFS